MCLGYGKGLTGLIGWQHGNELGTSHMGPVDIVGIWAIDYVME